MYWPIRGEPDLRAWIDSLRARGARCALPVVVARDAPRLKALLADHLGNKMISVIASLEEVQPIKANSIVKEKQ